METITVEQHNEEIKKLQKKDRCKFNIMFFVAMLFLAGFVWQLHSSTKMEIQAKDAYKKVLSLLIQADDQKKEFAKYKVEHP